MGDLRPLACRGASNIVLLFCAMARLPTSKTNTSHESDMRGRKPCPFCPRRSTSSGALPIRRPSSLAAYACTHAFHDQKQFERRLSGRRGQILPKAGWRRRFRARREAFACALVVLKPVAQVEMNAMRIPGRQHAVRPRAHLHSA